MKPTLFIPFVFALLWTTSSGTAARQLNAPGANLQGAQAGGQNQPQNNGQPGNQASNQANVAVVSGRVGRSGGEPLKKATVMITPVAGQAGQAGQAGRGGQGGRGQGAQGVQGGAGGRGGQPGQIGGQVGQNGQANQGLPAAQAGGQALGLPGQTGGGQQGQLRQQTATTGDDGKFVFQNVPPGQYRISATRDGFLNQEYGQRTLTGQGTPVVVSAGQRLESIDFSMVQAGVVAGRILDEDGQPMVGVQVQALTYVYRNGQRTLVPGKQAQTNDLGEYRLYWLNPGEYYVSVIPNEGRGGGGRGGGGGPRGQNPQAGAPAVEKYAPSYYPGVIDPLRAAPIVMNAGGNEIRGIDFSVRPVATATVSGRIVTSSAPPPASVLTQIQNRNQNQQNQQQNGGRGGGQNGGRGGGQGNQNANQNAQGARGAQNPGGQPNPQGAGGQPPAAGVAGPGQRGFGGIDVLLVPSGAGGGGGRGGRGGGGGGRGALGPGAQANVANDGSFQISNVVPGSYTLVALSNQNNTRYTATTHVDVGEGGVQNVSLGLRPGVDVPGQIYTETAGATLPPNFSMQNVRINLTPVDDIPLGNGNVQAKQDGSFILPNVAAMSYRVSAQLAGGAYLVAGRYGSTDALNSPIDVSDGGQLQLQIGFTPGTVSGTSVDSATKPFSAATVVLVPAARGRLDLYRTATSDQNGAFRFNNTAPGEYKLFAWEEIQQGAYQDPAFLDRYEDRGRLIHLDKSGAVTEQVSVIAANRQ